MKQVKAYFFSWMGTLGDVSEESKVKDIIGNDFHDRLLLRKFEDANIPEKYREEVKSRLQNSHHWMYRESSPVIRELREKHKLAIISNAYEISAKIIRSLFPTFLENFDVITFSSEVGLKKPHPEIFYYTLEKLNKKYLTKITPDEVVMVGDKQNRDIAPALDIGMQAMLVDRKNGKTLDKLFEGRI